jgi:photosystem II stability/assembly factor-like uncharacterized protein
MRTLLAFLLLIPVLPLQAQTSAWEQMNRGLQHTLVYTIAIDPVDSLTMYCGTDYGRLYKSTDGGFNWMLRNEGIPTQYNAERVTALTLDPHDRTRLYAGFSGRQSVKNLFRSTDGAASWEIIDTPDDWKKGGVLHVFRAYGSTPVLFAGLGYWHGVYMKPDGAQTWTQCLNSSGVQCITGHPEKPEELFAGCSDGQVLLRSRNGGVTWSRSVQGILTVKKNTGVRSLAISPSNPAVIFAGVTGPGQGLYKSMDGGEHWTRLNDIGEISEISIHPGNEGIMYISAIHSGVHRTTDGGMHWDAINEGLPTTDVMRVRIAPGYPVRVFAVTLDHGIFRMVDEELGEERFKR